MDVLALLPTLNATLNCLSACFLFAGFVFIKKKAIQKHRLAMLAAVTTSVLFLVSYLVYHFNVGSKHFQGEGLVRTLYFAVLLSHTVLAAVAAPMVLVTLHRALKGRFDKHRGIARITFPVWVYVSVTGVVIYLMLYQFFAAP